jgi:hypothetical protein
MRNAMMNMASRLTTAQRDLSARHPQWRAHVSRASGVEREPTGAGSGRRSATRARQLPMSTRGSMRPAGTAPRSPATPELRSGPSPRDHESRRAQIETEALPLAYFDTHDASAVAARVASLGGPDG